jgi:hypothetical protein
MASFPKGNKRLGESPVKSPRAGVPLNKEVMLKLIKEQHGNLSRVADMMGTDRHCIRRRIDNDEELQVALANARERMIDDLEQSCFDRAMESNDTGLQAFLLKTQGRHRGYDQSEASQTAKDIASAAFAFIMDKSKASQ